MITFYDLAARPLITTFSPNTWKIRYVLNFKKLSHNSVRIEFPEIADISKSASIPPSKTRPDGVTHVYTCPAITDSATGVAISDSYKIAQYLDKQYPDTPKVIPLGTEAFHAAFCAQTDRAVAPFASFLTPKIPAILNPPSAEYYIRTRSALYGKPLDQVEPVGEARVIAWAKVQAVFGEMDGWLSKSSGSYFMGEAPVFADFVVAGIFQSIKVVFGEDSAEWKDIQGWHNGRWKNLLKYLEQYEGAKSHA